MRVWHPRLSLPTAAMVARGTLYASVGFNVALLVVDLMRRDYGAAAAQSILIVALTGWIAFELKIHRRLDARVDEAVNCSRMSTIAVQQMEHAARANTMQVRVGTEDAERRH